MPAARTLLAAFLAGAETSIRIGLAVDGGFHHVGYHATGVVSHFASAVTAGKLLGLDEDAITAAQGITGSTAAGIQVFLEEGAWTKRFHPGWGAVSGITAAYLAQARFKGPSRVYEGKFGLFDTHLHEPAKLEAMTDGPRRSLAFRRDRAEALSGLPLHPWLRRCRDRTVMARSAGAEIAEVTAFLPQPTLHIIAEPAEAKQSAPPANMKRSSAPSMSSPPACCAGASTCPICCPQPWPIRRCASWRCG